MNPFYNRDQKRLRTTWRLLLQWLLYLIPTSLATVALLFAQTSFFQLNGRDLNGPVPGSAAINDFLTNLTSGIFLSVNSVVTLLILLGTILLAAKWIDKRKLSDFGFHFSRLWFRDLGFGMLLGAVLMCFIFLFEWAVGWIKVGPIALIPNPAGFSWIILIIYLLGFTAVGIYEELLFRGYQLRNLAEGLNNNWWGPKGALLVSYLISSLVFSLAHLLNPNASWVSTLNLFLAGIFLGLGFVLTGELAIPIGLHITWNFFQGPVFGFPVSGISFGETLINNHQGGPTLWTGGAFGPEAGLIGILAIIFGALLIMFYVKRFRGSIELQSALAVYEEGNESQANNHEILESE